MPKLMLTVGIPGSGKTVWSKSYLDNNKNTVRVSRDDFRYMLRDTGWCPEIEGMITLMVKHAVDTAFNNGFDVILDETNCKLERLETWIKHYPDNEVHYFHVSLEAAKKRNALREKPVPNKVIEDMFNSLSFSDNPKWYDYNLNIHDTENRKPCLVCDLDGTLAIHNGRSAFEYHRVKEDSVRPDLREILDMYQCDIILLSGREDSCKKLTEEWLSENNVTYTNLYMRKTGDNRKDSIIKKELYKKHIEPFYDVKIWFDDRDQVVDMVRNELHLTCYQVNYGNF